MTESEERAPILRIQQNLLARSERRLLTWLCGRMPPWVSPDLLTTIGMIGAAIVFFGYAASGSDPAWLWLAIGGFVVQWFGDSMDGSLARFRHIERPSYGYFIDHSCDGFATLLIMAGMGLSPYVRFDVAMIALVGYLLMAIHAFLLAKVVNKLRLSYANFGPTELRLVLIAVTLAMIALGPEPGMFGAISGFDILIGGAGTILIGLFIVETLRTARRLAKQESSKA